MYRFVKFADSRTVYAHELTYDKWLLLPWGLCLLLQWGRSPVKTVSPEALDVRYVIHWLYLGVGVEKKEIE